MGVFKNPRIQSGCMTITLRKGSVLWPTDMVNKSLTVRSLRKLLEDKSPYSGKNESALSVTFSLSSLTAKPTAVEVQLLLTEYMECFSSGAYGLHQASEITFP